MKLFILSLFKRIGFIVKLNNAKNNELLLVSYLIQQKGINKVLDVGANKGQFASSILKEHPNMRVLSFEPLSDAYKVLSTRSALKKNWEAHNYAIGSQVMESEIYVSANSHSSSLLEINQSHLDAEATAKVIRTEKIKVTPLHTLVNLSKTEKVFLKIDTQGFEMEVLKGSKGLFSNIELIVVELSLVELYKGAATFSSIVNYLEENGFKLYQLFPEFTDPETHQLLQVNGVFTKQ